MIENDRLSSLVAQYNKVEKYVEFDMVNEYYDKHTMCEHLLELLLDEITASARSDFDLHFDVKSAKLKCGGKVFIIK